MLKKTVTYTDYNGNSRTEDFYFNLTSAELTDMQLSAEGGLDKMIEKIVNAQDIPAIAGVFKDLLLKSYGERSADGKYFFKKDKDGRPLADMFAQSEAYSVLYMELARDDKAAVAFFNGIVPQDLLKAAQ